MKIPLLLSALTASLMAVASEDWSQWRGPHFNGSSEMGPLPTQFSKADARWVTPLPAPAGSTPVVSGDRIFLTTPDSSKNLNLLCLDAKKGTVLWTRTVAVGDKDKGRNNMAAPSPVTDGKRVIAMFGTGDVAAFDLEGRELWKRPLYKDPRTFIALVILVLLALLLSEAVGSAPTAGLPQQERAIPR